MQANLDAVHFGDHVVIGDDVAVLVDDEAGAGLFRTEGPGRHIARGIVTEEVFEQIQAVLTAIAILSLWRAAFVRSFGDLGRVVGSDIDHGGLEALGKFGEFVAKLHGIGDDKRRGVARNGLLGFGGVHSGVDDGTDDDADSECD